MNLCRALPVVVIALAAVGCSVVLPPAPMEGRGVNRRPLGRVGGIEVIAATMGGRKQVDVVCHGDPATIVYHPSSQRLRLIRVRLGEMLELEALEPGSSHYGGEVPLRTFLKEGVPKMTFGTTAPDPPGAAPIYKVNCFDAFSDHTQRNRFTRSEAEELRHLMERARNWLRAD